MSFIAKHKITKNELNWMFVNISDMLIQYANTSMFESVSESLHRRLADNDFNPRDKMAVELSFTFDGGLIEVLLASLRANVKKIKKTNKPKPTKKTNKSKKG